MTLDPDRLALLMGTRDDAQLKAAKAVDGTYVVVGNPGAGKTGTLVCRIAWMVQQGVDPTSILAMTFTNDAADEMNERLVWLGVDTCRVGTIHSVLLQVLRESNGLLAGLQMDHGDKLEWDLEGVIKQAKKDRKIPRKGVVIDAVKEFVACCKASRLCYVEGDPFGTNRRARRWMMQEAGRWARKCGLATMELYTLYLLMEAKRAELKRYGFDDMQLWGWMKLITSRETLEQYRSRWKYVIVDECQDSTLVQWDAAKILAGMESDVVDVQELECRPRKGKTANLMAVGDPSQSLYLWRFARPDDFVEFSKRKDVTTLVLPNNYRSVPEICEVSTAVVIDRPWHLGGVIKPVRSGPARGTVRVRLFENMYDEMDHVLSGVLTRRAEGCPLRECAVLSRLSTFLYMLELECARRQLPYELRASGSFYESVDARTLLGYLRVALRMDAGWQSEMLVMNRPGRYIPRRAMEAAISPLRSAGAETGPLVADLLIQRRDLQAYQVQRVRGFKEVIHELQQQLREGKRPHVVLKWLLKKLDYISAMSEEGSKATADSSRLLIVDAIIEVASYFETAQQFVLYVEQATGALEAARKKYKRKKAGEGAADALVLSTIHRAKGLGWRHVWVPNVTSSSLPCRHSEYPAEERRLYFVAVSRAKDSCEITATVCKGDEKSPFILLTQSLISGSPEE